MSVARHLYPSPTLTRSGSSCIRRTCRADRRWWGTSDPSTVHSSTERLRRSPIMVIKVRRNKGRQARVASSSIFVFDKNYCEPLVDTTHTREHSSHTCAASKFFKQGKTGGRDKDIHSITSGKKHFTTAVPACSRGLDYQVKLCFSCRCTCFLKPKGGPSAGNHIVRAHSTQPGMVGNLVMEN